MEKNKTYNSYNQIIKEFDVMGVPIQEVITNKQLKDKQCLVLFDKKPGPNGPHNPTTKELLMKLYVKVETIEKNQQQDHEILMKLVKRVDRIEDILERNNLH